MYLELEEIEKERKELEELNDKLKFRAEKFNADYRQLTLDDFRLLKLRKAQETGDVNYLKELMFEEVTDLEEREKLIRERTRKFYNLIQVEDAQKFFEDKIVPDFSDEGIVVRPNAIHLYGVDYMSTKMILAYFGGVKIRIEWLNDSSCNIAFDSEQILTETVSNLLLKTDQVGGVMVDESEEMWRELIPYVVDGTERRLFCRQATNKDVKGQNISGKNSKYYQYSLSKLQLKKFVRNAARNKMNREYTQLKKPHGRKKIQKIKRQKKDKKQQQSSSSSEVESSESEIGDKPEVKNQSFVKNENLKSDSNPNGMKMESHQQS